MMIFNFRQSALIPCLTLYIKLSIIIWYNIWEYRFGIVIFQDFETRFFLVFSVQIILVGLYAFLAVLILRRNRNRLTYLLSTFFSLTSLTFVLDAIISIVIQLVGIYFLGVYNAFPENDVFRAVWSILTFILIPLSGLMIYLGIGKNLE